MKKRILLGHLTIILAVAVAIGGTFLLDYLEVKTNHPERLQFVFGAAGMVMGLASIAVAVMFYSNNMGDGFKD